MAAIVQPHRLPAPRPARPDLRLVQGGRRPGPVAAAPVGLAPWLLLAALVLVVAGAVAIGRGALADLAPGPSTPAAATGAPAAVGSGRVVVVRAGDTMWSIARRLQPSGDVRSLVDRLIEVNGTAQVQAGDRIVIPASH